MRLQLLIITLIQVAVIESTKKPIISYHGNNVTLLSGANSSWTLTKIEWSIYQNNTWIATYQRMKTNVDRFYSYKGRLYLNTTSGDLTIRNLKLTDSMEYIVNLVDGKGHDSSNKIVLHVKKQLQPPTIQIINSNEGECWVELNCSSHDGADNLTWHYVNSNVYSSIHGSDGSSAVRFELLSTRQKHINFTCTSMKGNQNASSDYTLECEEPLPPRPLPFWLGLLIGILLGVLLTLAVIYKEKLKLAYEGVKERLT